MKLILRNSQSPGDIVMLTAAVRDLHACRPGQFLTDVRTPSSNCSGKRSLTRVWWRAIAGARPTSHGNVC